MHLHQQSHTILQGRPQDVSTCYKQDTYGAQRLGTGSKVNIQDRKRSLNVAIGMVLGKSFFPVRRKSHSESVSLYLGTNPSVSLGLLSPTYKTGQLSVSLSEGADEGKWDVRRDTLGTSQKEGSRQTHRVRCHESARCTMSSTCGQGGQR